MDGIRLVGVKRVTETERPRASLFERSEFAMRTGVSRKTVGIFQIKD